MDLDEAEDVQRAVRRICAALEVDAMEDGWAEECLGKIAALAEAKAEIARLRALVVKWHADVETYPDSLLGQAARTAVLLCADELTRALAAAPAPTEDGEADHA